MSETAEPRSFCAFRRSRLSRRTSTGQIVPGRWRVVGHVELYWHIPVSALLLSRGGVGFDSIARGQRQIDTPRARGQRRGDSRGGAKLTVVIRAIDAPAPTPTVFVEVVSAPGLEIAGLIVSFVTAIVGAVAAVASWRAATAARKATASGDEAARHAAEAARAAILSAEYQRATFVSERQAQLMTYAQKVFVTSEARYEPSEGGVRAQVKVENRGDAPITEVSLGVTVNGAMRAPMQQVETIAAGGMSTRIIYLSSVTLDECKDGKVGGVAHFRDPNGLWWERRTGRAPTGMEDPAAAGDAEDGDI